MLAAFCCSTLLQIMLHCMYRLKLCCSSRSRDFHTVLDPLNSACLKLVDVHGRQKRLIRHAVIVFSCAPARTLDQERLKSLLFQNRIDVKAALLQGS